MIQTDVAKILDVTLDAFRPDPSVRSEIRLNQIKGVPALVMELGVDDYADLLIQRFELKIEALAQADGDDFVNPQVVKDTLAEIVSAIRNLKDKRYSVAYTVTADNRDFVAAVKQISGMIERLILLSSQGKVTSDLSNPLRELGMVFTVSRDLNRLNRSLTHTLDQDQNVVGLVTTGDVTFNIDTGSVFVPIGGSADSETDDPLVASVVMAMQTAVALLLAHEIKDDAKKKEILTNPAALLEKYNLFSGFEGRVLRPDGRGGITISTQAIQQYMAAQAVKRSA